MKTFAALICASIALHGYFMPVMAANANDAADTASTQHTFHDEEVRHMKEDHHMDEDDYDQESFFKMHDLNGDGSLDASELERIYHQDQGSASANGASPEAAKQAVESFLSMADSDGDKKVSFKEFQASLDLPYEPENAEDDGEVPLSFQDGSH